MEWGSHSAYSRLALITINLKKKYTGHSKSHFILAHNFKCCIEFTRHNTLPLLRHFALEADYFQDEELILILSTTLFDTSCVLHHNTHLTQNFSTYDIFVNETCIPNL